MTTRKPRRKGRRPLRKCKAAWSAMTGVFLVTLSFIGHEAPRIGEALGLTPARQILCREAALLSLAVAALFNRERSEQVAEGTACEAEG